MTDVSFYEGIIKIYRGPLNHLKAVRRGTCPMYPSCSEYSRQAIARFGLIKGWVMSMDRLMRCGRDEMRLVPKIWVNGQLKYFDPIENNAFWHHQAADLITHPHLRIQTESAACSTLQVKHGSAWPAKAHQAPHY